MEDQACPNSQAKIASRLLLRRFAISCPAASGWMMVSVHNKSNISVLPYIDRVKDDKFIDQTRSLSCKTV
jgi:hypothetical protein